MHFILDKETMISQDNLARVDNPCEVSKPHQHTSLAADGWKAVE